MKPFQRFTIFILCVVISLSTPVSYAQVNNAQSAFHLGMALKSQGRLDESERMIKKALEMEPSNHTYHFELANVYALQFDQIKKDRSRYAVLTAAARELEQVVMLDPQSIQAYFNLGVIYKKQGEYERAREQFRHVLEVDPNLVNAYMQIGATYEEQGFFDDAKDAYLKAQEYDFGNPGILSAMDDLKIRKQEDRDRMLAEQAAASSYRRRFAFTPYSQAAGYEQKRQENFDNAYGLVQAIPYLSTWLVSQFMGLGGDDDEGA